MPRKKPFLAGADVSAAAEGGKQLELEKLVQEPADFPFIPSEKPCLLTNFFEPVTCLPLSIAAGSLAPTKNGFSLTLHFNTCLILRHLKNGVTARAAPTIKSG
jgi:hypothetical protein